MACILVIGKGILVVVVMALHEETSVLRSIINWRRHHAGWTLDCRVCRRPFLKGHPRPSIATTWHHVMPAPRETTQGTSAGHPVRMELKAALLDPLPPWHDINIRSD